MNKISTIYCDEAGFTGNDLLNLEQPYFAYASVAVENSEADTLLDAAIVRFRLQNKNELKGRNLIRHTAGRNALRWLLEECRNRFHLNYSEKLFAIAGKLVELIYEPLFSDDSVFLYNHDFHRFLSNALYYDFKRDKKLAVESIGNVQALFKRGSAPPTFLTNNKRFEVSNLIDAILYFAYLNQAEVEKQFIQYADKSFHAHKWFLDLSLTSLHSTLVYWGQRHPVVNVVCDDSKPLAEAQDVIRLSGLVVNGLTLLNQKLASYEVNSVSFAKSHENPSLQLADLFASSACYALSYRDPFWNDLLRDHPNSISEYNLRPGPEYININNERCYRNGAILLAMIEESLRPEGFSMSERLRRTMRLISSVDITSLQKAMGKQISTFTGE